MDNRDRRKRVICDLLKDDLYVPMKEKELASFLMVEKGDRELFHELVMELLRDGEISLTKQGKIVKASKAVIVGKFISNIKGFGFVEVEGQEEDYFIPEEYKNGAFHLDTVAITLLPEGVGKRREAMVTSIISRGMVTLVGIFEMSKKKQFGFVVPDLQKIPVDIYVPKERSKGAVSGNKVVVEITDYGNGSKSPEGKIVEIIGHVNDPGVDILSIVKGYDIPTVFPEKVMNQVQNVCKEVSEADMLGRKDLRKLPMVTIDGEDAKDLDDAVSLSFDGQYYHLGVHIADVANYVQENSALDHEAYKRGTSVYLVDRVIPMLPHALSNGICSLNAGCNRLALSCLMKIDAAGAVCDYEICESIICVNERMTYTAVNAMLQDKELVERDPENYGRYKDLFPMFVLMEQLSKLLIQKREDRGAIDFDFPECKIKLDGQGRPVEIKPYERNVATRLIESFMLIANETVSQHFYWQELPFLYRVHGVPDQDKIEKLGTFIINLGFYMKTMSKAGAKVGNSEIHPKEIQKLLGKIAGTPQEAMISRLVLRSMQQAKYSTEATGHFGLACEYYSHFTSPIRRYPDLQIHRIIKDQLRGRMNQSKIDHYRSILPEVAKQTSSLERRAEEAERETDKLKKVEYMEQFIGECFDGVVSGITNWGVYVELENTVEGMVHVSQMHGDYYHYEESTYEMVGELTGKTYKLGMPVRIKVNDCDRLTKTISFIFAKEQ